MSVCTISTKNIKGMQKAVILWNDPTAVDLHVKHLSEDTYYVAYPDGLFGELIADEQHYTNSLSKVKNSLHVYFL